jgi:alkaline phosphatase D
MSEESGDSVRQFLTTDTRSRLSDDSKEVVGAADLEEDVDTAAATVTGANNHVVDGGGGATSTGATTSATSNSILFASCNSQHFKKNRIWPNIASRAKNASAFVWSGDAIYADERIHGKVIGSTPERMQRLYDELFEDQQDDQDDDDNESKDGGGGYAWFLQNRPDNMEIMGTWDDHDYGIDNGDGTFPYRIEAALMFVEFLEKSTGHAWNRIKQRARDGKGVYGVHVLDFATPASPQQQQQQQPQQSRSSSVLLTDEQAGLDPSVPARTEPLSDRSVAIFLLDVRSHKTPWKKEGYRERYSVDYAGDFLGDEQWTWLQTSLHRSTAAVNIIVQGLQVHADTFFDGGKVEDWSRYPLAQQRLYQLILSTPNLQAPILISGDVHMAQKLRRDCQAMDRSTGQPIVVVSPKTSSSGGSSSSSSSSSGSEKQKQNRRMLLEVTTSGLTHSWGSQFSSRAGDNPSLKTRHLDRSLNIGMHIALQSGFWTHVIADSAGSSSSSTSTPTPPRRNMQYSLNRNFAELEFDWIQRQVTIQILGEQVNSPALLRTTWGFDTLSGYVPPPSSSLQKPFLKNFHFRQAQLELQAHLHESPMNWNLTVKKARNDETDDDAAVWICLPYRGPQRFGLKAINFVIPAGTAVILYFAPVVVPMLFILFMLLRWNRHRRINVMQDIKKTKSVKSE